MARCLGRSCRSPYRAIGPVSGLRWPADRAWFVATEIDFEWTFVAGTEDLIDRLAVHPQLEATRTSPDSVANLPDEDA